MPYFLPLAVNFLGGVLSAMAVMYLLSDSCHREGFMKTFSGVYECHKL